MYNLLNQLASEVHRDNDHWWRNPATGARIDREKATLLFLVISELTEAGEGERKEAMDDHLAHRPSAEVELADALIRLFDYIGAFKYDLDGALRKAHPNIVSKEFIGLTHYFAYRFFNRTQTKPWQLLQMIQAVGRIAELEEGGGSPSRDIEAAMGWFIALVFDYCGVWNYDIAGAFVEKRMYNATRHDHTHKARLAAGGKKW